MKMVYLQFSGTQKHAIHRFSTSTCGLISFGMYQYPDLVTKMPFSLGRIYLHIPKLFFKLP